MTNETTHTVCGFLRNNGRKMRGIPPNNDFFYFWFFSTGGMRRLKESMGHEHILLHLMLTI